MKRSVIAVAMACGLFGLLAASPASALCSQCTCESSCDEPCITGPFIPDCPECNVSTCGDWTGVCSGSWTCTQSCSNQTCTDFIFGNGSNNTLNGTADKECIYGYDGNDTIDGEAGDDRIWGGNGTDTLYGDSGNDCLWGEAGNDHLDGESGSDYGNGGTGTDTCTTATESQQNCP